MTCNQILSQITNIDILENNIKYKFKNKQFLLEALMHPSMRQLDKTNVNYEKLELLGDAVLGFIITEMLFHKYRNYKEGYIAQMKSYLVSKYTIYKIANNILLDQFIIMSKGEEISGGRNNINNIENAMEAVIGAVYLDSNIEITKNMIHTLWSSSVIDISEKQNLDSKSILQKWSQKKGYGIPIYKIIDKKGADHSPIFTILLTIHNYKITAIGNSKKIAEIKAANKLLDII